jgi:hypothetical protein
MFKAWETLLEECTLAFMCGRLKCDGTQVPRFAMSSGEEWARKVLYLDRPFIEWTDVDRIQARWDNLFVPPNGLVAAIRPAKAELKAMTTVRNAIAHSSPTADTRFRNLVQGEFGGRRRFSRPAAFLVEPWPKDTTLTFFDRYAGTLETIAIGITG